MSKKKQEKQAVKPKAEVKNVGSWDEDAWTSHVIYGTDPNQRIKRFDLDDGPSFYRADGTIAQRKTVSGSKKPEEVHQEVPLTFEEAFAAPDDFDVEEVELSEEEKNTIDIRDTIDEAIKEYRKVTKGKFDNMVEAILKNEPPSLYKDSLRRRRGHSKKKDMNDLKRLFTTVVYGKEELFYLITIASKAAINTDAIDPHTFPMAEVMLGEKAVYVPYNPKEKTLEMHVVSTGNTENYLYDVVPLAEFMHILGVESPREHILANFVSRKSKANSKNTIDINGVSYQRDVVEQLIDCDFDDFISNLEYESKMTFEE